MSRIIRVLYVDPLGDTGVVPEALDARVPGLVVRPVGGHREAFEALADDGRACVVSGYALPETDGIAFFEGVRGRFPTVPFVLCTTAGDERVAGRAVGANVTEYVPSETEAARVDALASAVERASDRRLGANGRFDGYRSIVQAMGDGVYTLDPDGYVTAVNDTLLDLSGYERERLVGEHISLLLSDRDVARGDRLIRDLLRSDRDVGELRMDLQTVTGDAIPCETRVGLLTEGERFHGTVGVLRSIEAHEDTKRALREEKGKIKELHEVASEMESCQSADEIYDLTIGAAENILAFDICGIDAVEDGYLVPKAISTGMTDDGYSRLRTDEGIAGRTYQNHESYVIDDVREHPEAVPAQAEYRSLLSVPVGDRGVFQAGSRETGAFDHEDVELAELLLSHAAEVLRRIRSQIALRESEGKYRTLVEQSHDAIYIYQDDEFVFVNRRVCELSGYTREELYGMEIWDLLHRDDRERVRTIARKHSRGDHPPHYEARIVTRSGDVRHMEFSVRIITYEGETARLGSARDVTEHKRQKRELERQNERLEEFASVVSHDLRNPLNVAQGHLELAREGGGERHFEKSASALDRMECLIDDLLALARQGHVVSETEPVELSSVVERAWANVETKEATLVVESSNEVEADSGRLQELFENLFRNAVEHGGSDVTVRVGEFDDGFYVEDDGPGIPVDQREAVFEHGYSTSSGGSGLGLSIVDGIAKAHGWRVDVGDGERDGARFRIVRA